ncbi:MAG: metal-dependent transcriptional regulator [Oscillospiraceae bacterium]|nr:metal-dependent transcriptional regulator [Oscillospiraceae bacterium]
MINEEQFYTMKVYELNHSENLSASMEDYLEMIYRIHIKNNVIRINEIAANLHVKPSSASKMVNNLKILGYLINEKYGYIKLTPSGEELGKYLLYRHTVINRFLCILNNTDNELDQAEKIEHFLNRNTIKNLDKLTGKLEMYI